MVYIFLSAQFLDVSYILTLFSPFHSYTSSKFMILVNFTYSGKMPENLFLNEARNEIKLNVPLHFHSTQVSLL